MKITQDVRDYADGLSDNEKKALELDAEAALSATHRAGEAEAGVNTEEARQRGMAAMSETFKEMGGEIYLSETGEKREPID